MFVKGAVQMKIWLITLAETNPMLDPGQRSMKTASLAIALAQAGHTVIWWKSSVDHIAKKKLFETDTDVEWNSNVTVKFINGPLYHSNISFARLWNHIVVARRFKTLAQQIEPPDIVYCSIPTLEMALEAVRFGRKQNIPVYLDIRDLWPDEFYDRVPAIARPLVRLLLLPLSHIRNRALRGASGLTAVSPEYLQWGLRHARRAQTKMDHVFMLGYPRKTNQPQASKDKVLQKIGIDGTKKIFSFISTFNNSVDIDTIISAAEILENNNEIQIVICGSGEGEDGFHTRAKSIGNLFFTGWIDKYAISELLKITYAGLVSYVASTRVSLPNKVFEYLSEGIPILTSLKGDARSMVEENDCGKYYRAGNAPELAEMMRDYANDSTLRHRQSVNAQTLFDQQCAVEVIYPALIEFLDEQAAWKRQG